MKYLFFNTAIEYTNKNIFERIGDGCLVPTRYLSNGKKITIFDKKVILIEEQFEYGQKSRSWGKIALAVIALVPSLILGSIFKGLALFSSLSREHRAIVANYSGGMDSKFFEEINKKVASLDDKQKAKEQIALDILEIQGGAATKFQGISIQKIYEFSEKATIYEKHFKDTVDQDQYISYKQLIEQLRQSKVPFRSLDAAKIIFNPPICYRIEDWLGKIPANFKNNVNSPEWKAFEVKLLKECQPEVLELASRINWIHGTNSSILPLMKYSDNTLIPTGKLLDKGISPMCGEISQGGMQTNGVNQHNISVDTIKGVKRCWKYATSISNTFDPKKLENAEKYFTEKLDDLEKFTPDDNRWDPCLVSLYQLKQWNPTKFMELAGKYSERIADFKTKVSVLNSVNEKLLLKALAYDSAKLKLAVTDEGVRAEVEKDFPFLATVLHPIWYLPWHSGLFNNQLYQNYLDVNGTLMHIIDLKMHGQKLLQKHMDYYKNDPLDKEYAIFYKIIQKFDPRDNPDIETFLRNDIRPNMEARIARNERPFARRLNRFERLFSEKPFLILSTVDQQQLQSPFPMLLASTKLKSTGAIINSENHVAQAKLGEDIDLVFVEDRDMDQMQKWLDEQKLSSKVSVLGNSVLNAMQLVPLYHTANQLFASNSELQSNETQSQLKRELKNNVLPIYQQPYPNGEQRKTYGVAHALRCSMLSHVIASLYSDAGQKLSDSQKNLQLVAALLDSTRQSDQIDVKDSTIPSTLEQKILQDVGNLERSCLSNNIGDSINLWIGQELDSDTVQPFLKEAKEFIQLTEQKDVKTFIENSTDPQSALYQMLFLANKETGSFDLLSLHLYGTREIFDRPADYLLSKDIENKILV